MGLLKDKAVKEHLAFWSWNSETYQFEVSEEWKKLFGARGIESLPQKLSRNIPVETLLDNFIVRGVSSVAPKDRARVSEKLENFLLLNAVSGQIEIAYEGSTGELLWVVLESLWVDDRLVELTALYQDISHLKGDEKPDVSALAPVEPVSKNARSLGEMLSNNAGKFATFTPLLAAFLVGFNDAAESIKREAVRTWDIFFENIEVVSSQETSSFIVAEVTEEKVAQAEHILLLTYPPKAMAFRLVAYSPGRFPLSYKSLISVKNTGMGRDFTVHRSFDSPEDSNRNTAHVSGQPFTGEDTYSVPFTLENGDSVQILYVEVEADTIDPVIQEATREAAKKIQALF